MIFNSGERIVIIASLKWAAMEHDRISKENAVRDPVRAQKAAGFSIECARIAELLQKAR